MDTPNSVFVISVNLVLGNVRQPQFRYSEDRIPKLRAEPLLHIKSSGLAGAFGAASSASVTFWCAGSGRRRGRDDSETRLFSGNASRERGKGLRLPTGCAGISTPKSCRLANTGSSKILVSSFVDFSSARADRSSRPSVVSSGDAERVVTGPSVLPSAPRASRKDSKQHDEYPRESENDSFIHMFKNIHGFHLGTLRR